MMPPVNWNPDKLLLIISSDKQLQILSGDSSIKTSSCEKLMEVKVDSKLNFDDQLKTICIEASNTLRALARTTQYSSIRKRKILAFFLNAQFNYCPLIWMLHSRSNLSRQNFILWWIAVKRWLSFYSPQKYSDIHNCDVQSQNVLALDIVSTIFCLQKQSQYNLRQQILWYPQCEVCTTVVKVFRIQDKIWNLIPPELKQLVLLSVSKKQTETGYQ